MSDNRWMQTALNQPPPGFDPVGWAKAVREVDPPPPPVEGPFSVSMPPVDDVVARALRARFPGAEVHLVYSDVDATVSFVCRWDGRTVSSKVDMLAMMRHRTSEEAVAAIVRGLIVALEVEGPIARAGEDTTWQDDNGNAVWSHLDEDAP